MLGIIGIALAMLCLCYFAYTGWAATPVSLIATFVVCIFNGINLWTGFYSMWSPSVGGTFTNYILLFFFSSLYGVMMNETGACNTIAYKFIDWFGEKHIIAVLCVFSFLCCYGGISMFTIWFAVGPIMWPLFKKMNFPRVTATIVLAAGVGDLVLAAPGSTQIQNVIPTQFLGSTLLGAPAIGVPLLIVAEVISIVYAEYAAKGIMKKVNAGEMQGFVEMPGDKVELRDPEKCPNVFLSFLPMIALIGLVLVGSIWGIKVGENEISGTQLAILAMMLGTVVNVVFNWKYIQGSKLEVIKKGAAGCVPRATSTAIALGGIVGFGTVVSKTAAYSSIINWLIGLKLNVYWKAVLSTACIAGVVGSASAGSRLCLTYLAEYFLAVPGVNVGVLHTLIAFASVTLDSMPWVTGVFGMFALTGCTHKEGYKYVFIIDTLIPFVCTIIATVIVSLVY